MENAVKKLGLNLANERRARGWSQELLAKKSGLRRNTIALIERGEREPKILTLLRVARSLGTSVDKLTAGLLDEEGGPFFSNLSSILSDMPTPPTVNKEHREPLNELLLWLLPRWHQRHLSNMLSPKDLHDLWKDCPVVADTLKGVPLNTLKAEVGMLLRALVDRPLGQVVIHRHEQFNRSVYTLTDVEGSLTRQP